MGYPQFSKVCGYGKFVESWYAFMKLLDVDVGQGFCCDTCGPNPEVVVCDGTSLGYRQDLAMSAACTPEPEVAIKRTRYLQSTPIVMLFDVMDL